MVGRIGLVHATEVWPGSPGARRRAWVDALLTASLTRSGTFEIVVVSEGPIENEEQAVDLPALDAIALHLHGGMAQSVACAVHDALERSESGRLVIFGELLVGGDESALLAAQGCLVCRGLPNPIWAAEISRWLDCGSQTGNGKLLEPILPGWDGLPGGSFVDPMSAATLLMRTTLGVGACEASCGVTAFEGPHRPRHIDVVRAEVRDAVDGAVDRIEIVDHVPTFGVDGADSDLLALLACGPEGAKWTLPVTAVYGGDAGLWRRLHSAGVGAVRAALPSACARLCDALHAAVKPDGLGLALDAAHAAGIVTELMLQVGGPGETGNDRREAAAWLSDHAESIGVLVMRPYNPAPGSEVSARPERYGIWWPPGGEPREWVDRAGNNLVSRSKFLWELVEVARGLGIDVQTPGLTAVREVRRHRARVLRRYEVAGAAPAEQTGPQRAADVERDDNETVGDEVVSRAAASKEQVGPRMVEIELSAACNLRCVGCWCHSELLSSDRHGQLQQALPLPTSRITELLEELAALGVREIQFSGSGEPLVNPDAINIINHASALGLRTTLVTNGTLLDAKRVEDLAEAGLDQATVSLWAGDAETYAATHPGVGAGVFDRITSGLRDLTNARRRLGRPTVKTYHVISRPNSGGIEMMVRHALDTDVDQVEFQVIDLTPDTVNDLALCPAEVHEIEATFKRLKDWPEYTTHWLEKPHLRQDAPAIVWQELDDFGRFLRLGLLEGFTHLDGPHLRCSRGLPDEAMREIDDDVFELSFPERACRACSLKQRCFPDGAIGRLRVPTLKLTGTGSFLRRARATLRDPSAAEAELIREIPCFVGDLYSRIDYRGNVVACCKGSSAPLGNVAEASFLSVWSSARYETFRRNAKTLNKDDPYFAPFGCLRSCDNLGMNLHALYTLAEKPENTDGRR